MYCGGSIQSNTFVCGSTFTSPFANANGSVIVSDGVGVETEVNLPAASSTPTSDQVYVVAPSTMSAGFQNWMKVVYNNQSRDTETARDNNSYTCDSGFNDLSQAVACSTMFNEPASGSGGSYLAACAGDLRAIVPTFHISGGTGLPYSAVAVIQKVPGTAPTILGWQEMNQVITVPVSYQIELDYLGGGNAKALIVDSNGVTRGTATTTSVNTSYVNSSDPIGALFVGAQATHCGAINTQHQFDVIDFQYQ